MIWVEAVGAVGIVKDIPARQLDTNMWSDVKNFRFREGSAIRITGEQAIYQISASAVTFTQALAVQPHWILPVQYGDNHYWLYANLTNVYAATSSANRNDITRQSATTTASITTSSGTKDFSATTAIRWSGDVLGGLAIINNGVNAPYYWNPAAITNHLVELDWDTSAGTKWSTRSEGATVCRVFRTYREYGIGLYTTENGTDYPRRLRWSHPATPGGVPATWDETDTALDAGYKDFDESMDELVDALPLGDRMIIYKRTSTWAMQYTGGQYVHQFYRLFDNSGLLTQDCVQAIDGKHIVVTRNDVIIHDGSSMKSVATGRVRRYLFDSIDPTYYTSTFTILDDVKHEFWIVYPYTGALDRFCNQAAIWNYQEDVWTFRDVRPVSFGKMGAIQAGAVVNTSWDADPGIWSTAIGSWGFQTFSQFSRDVVLSDTDNNQLVRADAGQTLGFTSALRKEFLTISGISQRTGQPYNDIDSIKQIRRVALKTDDGNGETLNVYLRTRMVDGDSANWRGPFPWVVGSTRKIDLFATFRILDIRIETQADSEVKILAYGFDLNVTGKT